MENKEKMSNAVGNLPDSMISEALDYQPKRIVMTKRKMMTVIAAAVALVALVIVPVGAKSYLDSHRLGVFNQQSSEIISSEIITITAEKAGENIVKFTAQSNDPEYSDVYIYSYELVDYYGAMSTPYGDNFGKLEGSYTNDEKNLKIRDHVENLALYLEKEPFGGKLRRETDYTLRVEGIAAKKADGSVVELLGEWTVKFRL